MHMENERIKELRKALNLNQEDFGTAIGLTKSSISNVEKGVRNVTEQHIKLITTSFNVNEDWLRTGEGKMFIPPTASEELLTLWHSLPSDKQSTAIDFIKYLASQPTE